MNEPKCPYCGEEMKHTAPRLRVKPCGVGVTWQCRYYCESCGSRAPLVDLDCETEAELIQAARAAANRAQQKAENPTPMTLDELRGMDGEPVWIVESPDWGHWELSSDAEDYLEGRDADFYGMRHDDPAGRYGLHKLGWLAYRHKPQGA